MCGIFTLLNNRNTPMSTIKISFEKGYSRGPENTTLTPLLESVLGFHRLAINGINDQSNQPIIINDVILICNGEIYNYKELYDLIGIHPKTASDCEIIIHLYIKYGIEQTLNMIDGEFAFVLYDARIKEKIETKIYIARDPFGVRPLYILNYIIDNANSISNANFETKLYGFASELKSLIDIYNINNSQYELKQFTPGTFSEFYLSNLVNSFWEPKRENITYFIPNFSYNNLYNHIDTDLKIIAGNITTYFNNAVVKRCVNTERPVACLLSGGLDSSLVAALANNYYKTHYSYQLETYSIGLAGSEDLKYARLVSDYLGTNHTEIIVTETEIVDVIPEVIYAIESYDTTTIRASIGNYLLGKYIKKNSEAKVILNGDGSDELFGGYIYMNKCPDSIEFDKETRRLLKDIYLFDVLRSDKCISSHGLEPRTPFLDRSFVNYCLSIPSVFRNHNLLQKPEKFLLRNSFTDQNFLNYQKKQILPDEVLWRKKEAFSDGVTSKNRSLYQILQENIAIRLQTSESKKYQPCIETEKYYYKKIFDTFYPNCNILPYFWMPNYVIASDPSARTLDIYSAKSENQEKL